jgi:hypothetical protein
VHRKPGFNRKIPILLDLDVVGISQLLSSGGRVFEAGKVFVNVAAFTILPVGFAASL